MNAWDWFADLDELLDDEVTLAVMRADRVTEADIRRLFRTIHRRVDQPSCGSARSSTVPPAS